MIRIILADDHPVVREGLRAMLSAESDLEVVADASSGPQAEALAAELRPDIVLMDLRMPGGGGVDSIVRMAGAGLPCRVVVLTTYETDRDILRAVEAGAAGYLLKDLPRAELADAVRAAARGETVLAPSVAARLVDQLRTKPERPRLSERETAVLRLVAEGCTNAEIGRRLFIGESTVKTYLLRVFGKLGVDDGRRRSPARCGSGCWTEGWWLRAAVLARAALTRPLPRGSAPSPRRGLRPWNPVGPKTLVLTRRRAERTEPASASRATGAVQAEAVPVRAADQPSRASSSATISFTPTAVCSPDSMSLSWTTPSARSRSPATTV